MVHFAVATFGAIHHCVNNAAVFCPKAPLHEQTPEDFSRVMSVNTTGVFLCMRAELRQMLAQLAAAAPQAPPEEPAQRPWSLIDWVGMTMVNVCSTAGQVAVPEFSPYSASKHAVIGLTRTAAKEYSAWGIRINYICPGTTDTPMMARFTEQYPDMKAKMLATIPAGRMGTAEETAQAILWLSSAQCPMVCGTGLVIDGAQLS